MADRNAPLLDLTAQVERPSIRIDGELYDILSPDEITIIDANRLLRMGQRLAELAAADGGGDQDSEEMESLLTSITDRILEPLPAEVRARLSAAQRMRIMGVFTTLLPAAKEADGGSAIATSTGGRPLPASNGSTAPTPISGSRRRPSRSSASTPK